MKVFFKKNILMYRSLFIYCFNYCSIHILRLNSAVNNKKYYLTRLITKVFIQIISQNYVSLILVSSTTFIDVILLLLIKIYFIAYCVIIEICLFRFALFIVWLIFPEVEMIFPNHCVVFVVSRCP